MKPQKLLYQNFLKYLKLKVTKGELWIFIQLVMTSYQEQSVLPRHRLRPIRVKKAFSSSMNFEIPAIYSCSFAGKENGNHFKDLKYSMLEILTSIDF